MKEISIYYNIENKQYATKLASRFKHFDSGIICAQSTIGKFEVVSIAYDCKLIELDNKLKLLLCKDIITINKTNYFSKKLYSNNFPNEYRSALIDGLILYDIENDYEYCLNKIDINKNIVINSFFEFNCFLLKYKWKEFIELINANAVFMYNTQILSEFLRFLVENIQSENKVVNVIFDDNFSITSKNNVLFKNLCSEEELISKLVVLAPKTINLYCRENMSKNGLGLLSEVFSKRINYLV